MRAGRQKGFKAREVTVGERALTINLEIFDGHKQSNEGVGCGNFFYCFCFFTFFSFSFFFLLKFGQKRDNSSLISRWWISLKCCSGGRKKRSGVGVWSL